MTIQWKDSIKRVARWANPSNRSRLQQLRDRIDKGRMTRLEFLEWLRLEPKAAKLIRYK